MLPYFCKSLLAVDKDVDDCGEGKVHFVTLISVCRHENLFGLRNIKVESLQGRGTLGPVEQGPLAVCDSPSPAANRRNRENPAPLLTGF